MTLPVAEPDPADLAEESAPIAWLPEEEAMPGDTAGIVAFILRRFHEVHRQELPALLDLARTV